MRIMAKAKYEFKVKDKKGNVFSCGSMQIKNQINNSADLYFYGDITGSTWENWRQEDKCPQDVADFLNQLNGAQNINIYINSGGGDSFAGIAIYNMLKRNSAYKTAYIDGVAASSASIIAMAADKIVMTKSSQFMIHNSWTIAMGNANDLQDVITLLRKVDESMLNIYMENAIDGIEESEIKQKMDATTWMNGTDAAGCFKNVELQDIQIAAYAESRFYSNYKNVPEILTKKDVDENNVEYVTKEYFESKFNELTELIKSSKPQDSPELKDPEPTPVEEQNSINTLKAKLALELAL